MIAFTYLAVGTVCFGLGWYARTVKMERDAQRDNSETLIHEPVREWTDYIVTAAFVVLVIGFIVNIVYTNLNDHQQNKKIEAAQVDSVERNTALTECIAKWAKKNSEVSALRSEATEKRDKALVASKTALSHLIDLRIIKHVNDSPAVQKVAREYMKQTKNYVDASMDLNRIRRDNPIPEFEDYCKTVVHSSKNDTK